MRDSVDCLKCAKEICQKLRYAGHTAYFAGGFVRDHLLNLSSTDSDIDIATDALPEEIVQMFPDHVLVGAQFGVVLVLYKEHQFEVATFRKDELYENGRSPTKVALKSSPKEDACRRDFTINGMFFDPLTEELHDYVGGKIDLEKKLVRTIGSPDERFTEDRLRMLRAIRFTHRFGFTLDDATRKAIIRLSHTLLPSVSMERIWQEFCKMRAAQTKNSALSFKEALLDMHTLGLLQTIFPPLKNITQDALNERLKGLETLSAHVPTILFLVKLFGHEDTTYVKGLHQTLKASNAEGKWIDAYVVTQNLQLQSLDAYQTAKLLAESRFEITFEVRLCKEAEEEKTRLNEWYQKKHHELDFFIHRLRKKEPFVKAIDLQNEGIIPGKEMGKLLEAAEKIAINSHLTDKDVIIEKLRKTPQWPLSS